MFSLPRDDERDDTADPDGGDGGATSGGFVRGPMDDGQNGGPSSVMRSMGRYGKQATKARRKANGGADPIDLEEDLRYRQRMERQESSTSHGRGRSAVPRSGTPFTRESSGAWPQHFLKLEKTFKAVNLVHSFCSARKHMAPTFDVIKSGAENLLKR